MQDNQENSFACRECKEVYTEESGASEDFLCEECEGQMYASIDSFDKNTIVEGLINTRMKKWILTVFKNQETHGSYIEYGHIDESYKEFLIGTYNGTTESFPETIQLELGEITREQYNNIPKIRKELGLDEK
jgi:hypothetical protein